MIIFRYLNREIFKSTLAVLSVLLTIFVSQKLVRILADATEGKVPSGLVMQLLGLNLPTLVGLMLPLAVFFGILLGVSRFYADSEMSVFRACGISEWYVTRVLLIQASVLAIFTAMMTIWWGPKGLEQEYQVLETARTDARYVVLAPGKFQSGPRGTVLMVEALTNKGMNLDSIFVAQNTGNTGEPGTLVVADSGRFEEDSDGILQLILEQGAQYRGVPGHADFQTQQFDSYSIRLEEQQAVAERRKYKARPMVDLWQEHSAESMAEFHWRLAVPLSLPLMTLIAVPMAAVNPRQGKFAKLAPAFMLYLGYYVLLSAGKTALEEGDIPISWGLWWVHVITLTSGSLLLLKSRTVGQLVRQRLLGWRRGAKAS